ncbi:MAG: hypothetical protein IJW70_08875 [Clostridia bacterium]|nr:hypothetical protein [Clostridia bacterium]
MDFMFLSTSEQTVLNFDARAEIVSKDRFFDQAKKYISTDPDTLLYRQSLFGDILKVDRLAEFLASFAERLKEYAPLMQEQPSAKDGEQKMHNILVPTVYIEITEFIYNSLLPCMDEVASCAIKGLFELVKNDMESDEYKKLAQYYEKNADKLRSVSSVTIGVNLNALLEPKEAGLVSINSQEYKSGDLLDRILRMDFEKDDFHCAAPLISLDKKLGYQDSQRVNFALLKAMSQVMNSSLAHCNSRCLRYAQKKLTAYFAMAESLSFVTQAIKRLQVFIDKKIPLCFPKISHDRSLSFVSLYDDKLCQTKEKSEIVPNTISLDADTCCYILAGPNSGGKTVFLNSVAVAQYYFQLGMPIPAKEASLPICDAIFKVCVEEQANINLVGRFEKECITLSEVLSQFTDKSLALIDEAFTSTSAAEAVPIAANFIAELCRAGGKCIFITHHHELCDAQPKIEQCGNKVGYLHTQTTGDKRTFTVHAGKAESGSYAQSIAKKYGLIE